MTAPTSSTTVLAQLRKAELILTNTGIENPDGEAREIIAASVGCTPSALRAHYDDEMNHIQLKKGMTMLDLRLKGEPLQYILGAWSFMGRDYRVGHGVLIPRDDTEVVVTAALELMKHTDNPRIVDLCSGSGIIAITLEQELKNASVTAIEKSPEAYLYLRLNCQELCSAVNAFEADLFDCADRIEDGSFDLIISNPPYIPSREIATLQKEVQCEPRMALDGGEDGCDFYRAIIRLWTAKLKAGGCVAFELGEEQFQPVSALLMESGYTDIKGYPDLQGTTRAVTARRKP